MNNSKNHSSSLYDGKRAIMIGATSGIGQEVARLLLAEGWHGRMLTDVIGQGRFIGDVRLL